MSDIEAIGVLAFAILCLVVWAAFWWPLVLHVLRYWSS